MATSDALDRRRRAARPAARAAPALASDQFALAAAHLPRAAGGAAPCSGPALLEELATRLNLRMRNAPPFTLEHGWLLRPRRRRARPQHPRAPPGRRPQNTLTIAAAAVAIAMVLGGVARPDRGLSRAAGSATSIMRLTDIVMSFPSLLLAVVVLYMFAPRASLTLVIGARDHPPAGLHPHHPRRGARDPRAHVRRAPPA